MSKMEATGIVDWSTRKELTLGQFDLFDRVINLRLVCGNSLKEQDVFVVRSDYETYIEGYVGSKAVNADLSLLTDKNKAVIRRCALKPSIKVQCKQVCGNTAIEVDIFLQNFYVLSSDGQTLMQFSHSDYPLKSVEVQMGYFGQWNHLYAKQPNGVPTAEQYFSMEAPEGVQTLFCNVQYVQTDKLPPDYTLHIHGFVGSCYNEPVKVMAERESGVTEEKEDYGVKLFNKDNVQSFTSFQHYLFNNVTRRFLRRTTVSTDKAVQKKVLSSIKADKNGLMDFAMAKQYGVRVFVSEGMVKHYKFSGKEVIYDGEGNKNKVTSVFSKALSGDTPMKCLNDFASSLPQEIRVFPCDNGDYMVCTKDEAQNPENLGLKDSYWYTYDRDAEGKEIDADSGEVSEKDLGLAKVSFEKLSAYIHASMKSIGLPSQATIDAMSAKEVKLSAFVRKELPAVYNITSDALTTILCPFFWFLNPFDSIKFRSRYSLGGLTGYYADFTAKDQYFMMLWQDVTFATVEDLNDVQMVCCVLKNVKEI